MRRALLKGAVLFGFGRLPGGSRLYRTITRDWLETQATHVDKLCRVWPGYVDVWQNRCGLEMEGLKVWVHESGWTPFPALVNYLLTGSGGVLTNSEGRLLDRYLARAVNGALACNLPGELIPRCRRDAGEALRWQDCAEQAVVSVGGKVISEVDPGAIPLESDSVDLCHSGGALEHYRPDKLLQFLKESYRILKPGGIASHVFDLRDHLHHADRRLPFLSHLALSDPVFAITRGHALLYHNRLLTEQIAGLFEQAGFERIAIRRMILPDRIYVEEESECLRGTAGIERGRLARRFRRATDADLHTAAAHFLYRKPEVDRGP